MIDNSSCLNAINTIKGHISACFTQCTAKGSTFSGTKNLSNLQEAISLIPTGGSGEGGTTSENITAGSFSGFDITFNTDDPNAEMYTINFGSIGVTWKSIVCFSDTKDGHFAIHKLTNNKCVISGACFYNAENVYDEASGIFPDQRNTYRATYNINGNSITFVNLEYDGTSNGISTPDTFKSMVNQVSTETNDYFTDQYKLDKITVCV